MELLKKSKKELIKMCEDYGITDYKSKNKSELVLLIESNGGSEGGSGGTGLIKRLKPLVKWSGGKMDEIKMFKKYFPEDFKIYIEPFVGGGSVYFYLNPNKAVISDAHSAQTKQYYYMTTTL